MQTTTMYVRSRFVIIYDHFKVDMPCIMVNMFLMDWLINWLIVWLLNHIVSFDINKPLHILQIVS